MNPPQISLQAQEAGRVAESDWYEVNGMGPGAEAQERDRQLSQDMFAAGVAWAAQHLDGLAAQDPKWFTDRFALRAAAAELRGEGT